MTLFGALAAGQMMAGREDGGVGSARRRRDRQLRAFRRHVQLTVRMELAAALHHSAQRVEGPREGELHEGPRAQKRPLPGMRPGLPPEPEPHVRAATVGRVAAGDGLPTLAMPSLAGAAGEVVEGGTLAFLTRQAVEDKRKAKQSKEEPEEAGGRVGHGAVGAAPSGGQKDERKGKMFKEI